MFPRSWQVSCTRTPIARVHEASVASRMLPSVLSKMQGTCCQIHIGALGQMMGAKCDDAATERQTQRTRRDQQELPCAGWGGVLEQGELALQAPHLQLLQRLAQHSLSSSLQTVGNLETWCDTSPGNTMAIKVLAMRCTCQTSA